MKIGKAALAWLLALTNADSWARLSGVSDPTLPPKLQEIVSLFKAAPKSMRLQILLEYSQKLPPLPAKYQDHPEFMQPVPECTSPFFLVTELETEKSDNKADHKVKMFFKVPEEAPTVRGYAGILHEALNGQNSQLIQAVPDQFYLDMGLSELITPLRMRGMGAILRRLKESLRNTWLERYL